MSDQKLHVVTLTPDQQVVLRFMLNDHFKRKTETMMAVASIKNPESADNLIGRFDRLFDCYEVCCAGLPSLQASKNYKNRMIYLGKTAMQHMVEAADSFDLSKSEIDDAELKLAEKIAPKLLSLLKTASSFTYSVSEIRKAGEST